MRVFDIYTFNIIDRVKFSHTKEYLDKMLSELGLSYNALGFRLYRGAIDEVIRKYPELKKYYSIQNYPEPGAVYSEHILSSFTERWADGEIYVDKADEKAISALFTKIPRPFNFGFCRLLLDGIDWYGNGDLTPATESPKRYTPNFITRFNLPFINSGIISIRGENGYDKPNKENIVYVTVEATAVPSPRDTSDIVEKLKPYLGEPLCSERKCMFAHEEYDRFNELTPKYEDRLEELRTRMLPEEKLVSHDQLIQKVVDRSTLKKAFKGTGFELTKEKGLPGMNFMRGFDSHNFKYALTFDRSPSWNTFCFILDIYGYNFHIGLFQQNFGVEREGESAEILAKIAEYCIEVRDKIGVELAADFGDTPAWYWDNE